jgi:hypothetical protein
MGQHRCKPASLSRTMSMVLGTKSSRIDRLELSTANTATDDDLHINLATSGSADDALLERLTYVTITGVTQIWPVLSKTHIRRALANSAR